jgi:hypothetical protein
VQLLRAAWPGWVQAGVIMVKRSCPFPTFQHSTDCTCCDFGYLRFQFVVRQCKYSSDFQISYSSVNFQFQPPKMHVLSTICQFVVRQFKYSSDFQISYSSVNFQPPKMHFLSANCQFSVIDAFAKFSNPDMVENR